MCDKRITFIHTFLLIINLMPEALQSIIQQMEQKAKACLTFCFLTTTAMIQVPTDF